MAKIAANSYPLEWNFIDNPVVVGLTDFEFPESTEEAPVTFKQIVIQVDVTPTYEGATTKSYTFRSDIGEQTEVWIDISTALRSAMNVWHPSPDKVVTANDGDIYLEYPQATFTLKAHEVYLLDGAEWTGGEVSVAEAKAFYGGLSEYELMSIGTHVADYYASMPFSKKPSDYNPMVGDIGGVGDWRIVTYLTANGVVRSDIYSKTDGQLSEGEYRQFLFVNSLGVLETATALMRESLSYGIESEQKSLVTSPAYFASPNLTATKSGGRAVMQMSSGIVSREWVDWWTTEFLMASRYWMRMGSYRKMNTEGEWIDTPLWLPCTVTPADDEQLIYNRAEQRLPHVDFEVAISVGGSLLNPMRF